MRIVILTVGSRGDVQPYVALGLGLQRAGYDVRIVTHAEFREFVTGYGLDFAVIEGNPRQMMETDTGQMWLASGRNPIAFMRGFMALAGPIAERLLATSWDACQGADAVLFSAFGVSGYHVAEKLGIPAISAALQPLTPTRYFPGVGTPPHPRLGGIYNRLTHEIYQQVFWQMLRPYINPWRRDVLKLDPMPWHGPYRRLARERLPFVYGYSPLVVPKPPDWGEWVHVCGYWFLDSAEGYQPPARLVDFLESGPPPVYIGFGSMIHRDPEQVAEMFVTALARSKQRGILLAGWGGLNHANLPDHVLSIDFAPHDWLFPRMAAIVHHGGAGTTAAALRSGAPSVVAPFFADQPFWAQRVHELGVAPKPIPQKQLTAARLAEAIHVAVGDVGLRARAADLGQRIRAEDGVARAVEVIWQYLSDRGMGHGHLHRAARGAMQV